ncbi:MAG: helix-turn-helix transcriptional regulator [Sphingobacteriales bacterium]|nr:helix-turn-helix transcriptional regulator [Sphingobacteriales bacterium]MBD3807722.1 helix-turn-helix transcriptional regulator [Campylobacterota bacterium]
MLSFNINTPSSVIALLKENFKHKRLSLNLTQEGLANKSGVSLGSLKRFEKSGQISLESLLKLSVVLECLDDFLDIANKKEPTIDSIDELLKSKDKAMKKRGRIK